MNYIIQYKVVNCLDEVLSKGTMRVKNKENGIHAIQALENHLELKIPHFNKMIVIGIKIEKEQVKTPPKNDDVNFLVDFFGFK
jgi:hypothetical protein